MEFVEPLLSWYAHAARDLPWRNTGDPYAVWISEIMLQQTRVSAVIPYYTRFLAALPDPAALSAVEDDALHKLWEGLGYYRRAGNLKRTAQIIVARFGGTLPGDYETLLTLPGFGAYTAGAVASIAFGVPVPAVDGNVLRVYARLFNDARDVALPATRRAVRNALLAILPQDRAGTFNSAVMELGACVCVPNGAPHCTACPVSPFCRARLAGTAALLPNKTGRQSRRIEQKTVFVLHSHGRCAGYKRPETGLLAGLWQLPDESGALDEARWADRLSSWGARPVGEVRQFARKHVFTHIEWHMRVYACEVDLPALPEGWRWLDECNALPTAYRVCLQGEEP